MAWSGWCYSGKLERMKEMIESKPGGPWAGNRSRMREHSAESGGGSRGDGGSLGTPATHEHRHELVLSCQGCAGKSLKARTCAALESFRALYRGEVEEEKVMAWPLRHEEKERGPMRVRGERKGCVEDARIPEGPD